MLFIFMDLFKNSEWTVNIKGVKTDREDILEYKKTGAPQQQPVPSVDAQCLNL